MFWGWELLLWLGVVAMVRSFAMVRELFWWGCYCIPLS